MRSRNVGARNARVWAFALICGLCGCADDDGVQDEVYTRVRPDAPFDSYKTFAIVQKGDVPDLSDAPELPDDIEDKIPEDIQLGLKQTESAIRKQMTMLGMKEVDVEDDPDLYVLDFAATSEEEGIYWECVPGYTWWGWWYYWDPCAWLYPVPVEYSVGSILVLVADPNLEPDKDHGQFVFGGLAQGVLTGGGNTQARIDDDVAEMFDDWPVE